MLKEENIRPRVTKARLDKENGRVKESKKANKLSEKCQERRGIVWRGGGGGEL